MKGAFAVNLCEIPKLGAASGTYVSQDSCPPTCSFKGNGCYAEAGNMRLHTTRVNHFGDGVPLGELAEAEAEAIEADVSGRYDLRLRIVGDQRRNQDVARVAETALRRVRWRRKKVWTYTHAWREVERKAYDKVSVLASCESVADVTEARDRGWNCFVVVDRLPRKGIFELPGGTRAFACPWQTHKVSCTDCRLCLRESEGYLARRNMAIAVAAHGAGRKRILASGSLVQLDPYLGRKEVASCTPG